jgi:hypothetical protein
MQHEFKNVAFRVLVFLPVNAPQLCVLIGPVCEYQPAHKQGHGWHVVQINRFYATNYPTVGA